MSILSYYLFLDTLNDKPHILITHTRPRRQAHSNLKNRFRNPVLIHRQILVYRLLMHRLPDRTSFNTSRVHQDTKSLHIIIRLAIRHSGISHVNHTRSSPPPRHPSRSSCRHSPARQFALPDPKQLYKARSSSHSDADNTG